MIVTAHWSATHPVPLADYHIEFFLKNAIDGALNKQLGGTTDVSQVDFAHLSSLFTIVKNFDFGTATNYGTWHWNHDSRDNSPNIEVGALCMGGEGVAVAGPWGQWPYTYAHSWMHAAIIARICYLKHIDSGGSFTDGNFQNGPLYNISTHAERAIQTPDSDATLRPNFGYFVFSGDPDCRWDIACRDEVDAHKLATAADAYTEAIANAQWLRKQVHAIKLTLNSSSDMWSLGKPAVVSLMPSHRPTTEK